MSAHRIRHTESFVTIRVVSSLVHTMYTMVSIFRYILLLALFFQHPISRRVVCAPVHIMFTMVSTLRHILVLALYMSPTSRQQRWRIGNDVARALIWWIPQTDEDKCTCTLTPTLRSMHPAALEDRLKQVAWNYWEWNIGQVGRKDHRLPSIKPWQNQ